MSEAARNELFMDLLMRLHYTAWFQLGKVTNPVTGKTERNMEAAKEAIDLLGALEEKTRGNRHEEEEKMLSRMLLDLRMNYVEELKSAPPAAATAKPEAEQEAPSPEPDAKA